MTDSKPTVVIVPGAWQLPSAWKGFISILQGASYTTKYVKPPTLGGTTLPLAGLADDIAAVRDTLISLLNEGKQVIVLCHSAGGLVASNAIEGLDTTSRMEAGLKGGVSQIIFLAAFMIPAGKSILDMLGGQTQPWMKLMGDRVIGDLDMLAEIAFNDLEGPSQQKWSAEVTHSAADLFTSPSSFEPWTTPVSIAYIYCTKDNALPYEIQHQMSRQAGPNLRSAVLHASHVPFLSVPDRLFSAIETVINQAREK